MKDFHKIAVYPHTSIKETMRKIDQNGIKLAIVLDKENSLLGVVSDGDIRRGILNGISIEEKVCKVMNTTPTYATINSTKEEIIKKIKKNKINGIPLIDTNKKVQDFVIISKGIEVSSFGKIPVLRKHINKILVIGGAGYIGSILTRKLLEKGYKVVILDNFIYGEESLDNIKNNSNLTILKGDTRHIEDITKSIEQVDAVVHLAELVGDPACALNPSKTQEINYFATRTIASLCKHFQINRLVYISSCSVYGASMSEELLTEESGLNPVSLYAKMKICCERALLEMKDDNFLPTILRLGTVFGFSHRPRFDLVINLLTAKALKDKEITIFGGDQWRPHVHVGDVADTIITTLEAPIEISGGQIFNVGSEENNYTINQVGQMIKEAVPTAEVIIQDKDVDKRDYKVDFSKLKKVLNIHMKNDVKYGINEIKEAIIQGQIDDYKNMKYNNYLFLDKNGKV